jgi:photosystem II stability/assembly factor-like uncharacterized protein
MLQSQHRKRVSALRILVLVLFCGAAQHTSAQHLRIYATAMGNDSASAFMGGSSNGTGLYQSDDTGKTWKHLGWNNIKAFSMDIVENTNGGVLYLATGSGVLRSMDSGSHWMQLSPWRVSEVLDIAVNQTSPQEIYFATAHGPWRTRNGGNMWQALTLPTRSPFVSCVRFDKTKESRALFGGEDGIFSIDQSSTWSKVSDVHAVRDLFPVPTVPNRWLAASDTKGLLISSDTVKSFRMLTRGAGMWCASEDRTTRIVAGQHAARFTVLSRKGRAMHSRTQAIRDVTAVLQIGNITLLGTLGHGIWNSSSATNCLEGLQISSLHSYIIK